MRAIAHIIIISAVFLLMSGCVALADELAGSMAKADAESAAILTDITRALLDANTLSCECKTVTHEPNGDTSEQTVVVKMMKPDYVNARITSETANPRILYRSNWVVNDGTNFWQFSTGKKRFYTKEPAGIPGTKLHTFFLDFELGAFYSPKWSIYNCLGYVGLEKVTYKGVTRWHGADCKVLEATLAPCPECRSNTESVLVGADNLIHGTITKWVFANGQARVSESEFKNLTTSNQFTNSDFTFIPPPGATEGLPSNDPIPTLIAAHATAPDFTVKRANGKPLHLSDFRGRVVVLDFWATWCVPCIDGMPHLNKVAKEFGGKDAVFIAVNVQDTRSKFKKWVATHPKFGSVIFAFDPSYVGHDIASTLYNVSVKPTQIVIGRDGRVTASIVGYNGDTDDLANAVRAAIAKAPQTVDAVKLQP